jgi:hypothetical protein
LNVRSDQVGIGDTKGSLGVDCVVVGIGAGHSEGRGGESRERRCASIQVVVGSSLRKARVSGCVVVGRANEFVVGEVDAVASAEAGFAIAEDVIGDAEVGGEVVAILLVPGAAD